MNYNFNEQLLKILLMIGTIISIVNIPIVWNISLALVGILAFVGISMSIIYLLFKKGILKYDKASSLGIGLVFFQVLSVPILAQVDATLLNWIILLGHYPMLMIKNVCKILI